MIMNKTKPSLNFNALKETNRVYEIHKNLDRVYFYV